MNSVFYSSIIVLCVILLLLLERIISRLRYVHKVLDWADNKECYDGICRYSDEHARIFHDVHSKQLKEFFEKYNLNDRISFSEFSMLVETETNNAIYKKVNKNVYKVKYCIYKDKFEAFECFTNPEIFTKVYGSNALGYSLYINENGICYFVILCKRD